MKHTMNIKENKYTHISKETKNDTGLGLRFSYSKIILLNVIEQESLHKIDRDFKWSCWIEMLQ